MLVSLRLATVADLEAINDLYNYYVPRSTCTYQEEPETMKDRRAWFDHHGPQHPITVAVRDGHVVGWGSLSTFRERSGYRFTVEDSVYVRHDLHGQGIGSLLLGDLIQRARGFGYHSIIAGADAEQFGSIALHAKLGFVEVGRMPRIGFKFDRWLDVVFMQLMLNRAST